MSDEEHVQRADYDQINAELDSGKKVGLIGMISPPRLGFYLFLTTVETQLFPPGTPKNRDFELLVAKWPGDETSMVWAVAVVPAEYLPQLDAIAGSLKVPWKDEQGKDTELPLSLHRTDGIPRLYGGSKGEQAFPINSKNAWTMENTPGSIVYRNNTEEFDRALAAEKAACDVLLSKYKEKDATE